MHVRKNDQIVVIAGNDRGKTGKVLKTYGNRRRDQFHKETHPGHPDESERRHRRA